VHPIKILCLTVSSRGLAMEIWVFNLGRGAATSEAESSSFLVTNPHNHHI
jgi:hypothetical protein